MGVGWGALAPLWGPQGQNLCLMATQQITVSPCIWCLHLSGLPCPSSQQRPKHSAGGSGVTTLRMAPVGMALVQMPLPVFVLTQ